MTSRGWRTSARELCICATACWNPSRPRRRGCCDQHVVHQRTRDPTYLASGGVADPGTRNFGHPRIVGRHETIGGVWFFGAADLLPGLGDDRVRGGPSAGGGPDRAHSARCTALGTALAVAHPRPRRLHRGAGRGSPVLSIAGVDVALGGTLHFLRITALSI